MPNLSRLKKLTEHFVGAEAANPDRLVARGFAADNLDRAARATKFFGQQINQSLIGGGIHRRRGHFDFQLPPNGPPISFFAARGWSFTARWTPSGLAFRKAAFINVI